jgi:HSP20 family molecular chaperone IbpA
VIKENTMNQNPSANQKDNVEKREPTLLPPVDVFEDASGITLIADLPGVSRDGLNLHVDGDTLSIEGDVSIGVPQGMQVTHAEVSLPRYRRVFTLSRELDTARLSAELKQGVLTVRIGKADHAQPRRISVTAG